VAPSHFLFKEVCKKRYAKKAWHFLGISKRLGEDKKILNFIQSYLGKRSGKLSTTEI